MTSLADATVRVLLDVSRFDSDLKAKVGRSAAQAGRIFEREFSRTARNAGGEWASEFNEGVTARMRSLGRGAGRAYAVNLRGGATGEGRRLGVDLGGQIRGGLVQTARGTARDYMRGILGNTIEEAGSRVGQRLGRAIGANITVDISGAGRRLGRALERDAEPSLLEAARNVASRFGGALAGALGAVAPGRIAVLGSLIAALVSSGTQLAAAISPALQAIGLIPAAVTVASAAVGSLVVAFQGVGSALSAAAAGDPAKLAEALEKLSPAARVVVREFARFVPQLRQLRQEVQQAFFTQLTGSLAALGASLIGPVQRGMTLTATAAGRVAQAISQVIAESRNAGIIERIFGSAGRMFDNLQRPLASLTGGILEWVRATLPAFDRVTAALGQMTARAADFLDINARSGRALEWVNQALTTISQLGQVTGNLIGVFRTVFAAANEATGGYLRNLNQALVTTRQFLSSGTGQTALVGIFRGLNQVINAVGEPIRELVVQLGSVAGIAGRVAQALSGGLTSVIRGLGQGITNAGDAIVRFAQGTSDLLRSIGPSVATLGTAFGRLVDAVAPILPLIGGIIRVGVGLLNLFTQLPTGVLTAVAAFAALRALGVDSLLSRIGATAATAGTSLMTAFTNARTQAVGFNNTAIGLANGMGQVGTASLLASRSIGGLTTAFTTVAGTARSAAAGLGSALLGAFGGPGGLAITAAITAISAAIAFFTSKSQEAARATREHQSYLLSLAQSFDAETGAITQNTVEVVRNRLEKDGLAQKARELGINTSNLISAMAGEGKAIKSTQDELRNKAREILRNSDAYKFFVRGGRDAEQTLNELTDAALGNDTAFNKLFGGIGGRGSTALAELARDALGSTEGIKTLLDAVGRSGSEMDQARLQWQQFQAALRGTVGNTSAFSQALDRMSGVAATAEQRTRALRDALRALEGGTRSAVEAEIAQNDALRGIADRIAAINQQYAQGGNRANEFGNALFKANGQIDASTKGASELVRAAGDLNDRLADVTIAQQEQVKHTRDVEGANRAIAEAYKANRDRVIELARAMGFSQAEAEKFADQMLRTPKQIDTTMNLVGAPEAIRQLGEVQLLMQRTGGQPVIVQVLTDQAKQALEALGFEVNKLSDGRFEIKAKTEQAMAALQGLKIAVDAASGSMKITADSAEAKAKIGELGKILNATATTKLNVDTGQAFATTNGLLVYINNQTGEIRIGAKDKDAKDEAEALKRFVESQTASMAIGANPSPARAQIDGLVRDLTARPDAKIPVGADGRPLITDLSGLLGVVNSSSAQVPTGLNTVPAQQQLPGLVGQVNSTQGRIQVGANTAPAQPDVFGLQHQVNTLKANLKVGADTTSAQATLAALIIQISRTVVTMAIRAVTQQGNAIGNVYGKNGVILPFANGGINSPGIRMPANRAEVVPPGVQRVIGDRALGKEAFIPLINSARSRAIASFAANELGFDLVPKGAKTQTVQRVTTVAAGAITISAPFSDPRLVARAVVNELTREAVI